MIEPRVTIRLVAQQAGVSTQTVSRVINHRIDVRDSTRARVLEVISRLGYQPSEIARSLTQGHSSTLGMVAFDLEYYGPARILSGVEQAANALGYSLLLSLLHRPDQDEAERILSALLSRRVEGIIWIVPETGAGNGWLSKKLAALGVPAVLVNTDPSEGCPSISIDHPAGGAAAARHLMDQGCCKLATITGPLSWWEARQRLLGWQRALQEAQLPIDNSWQEGGDWSAASGEHAARVLLERHPNIDGIFAANDQMALGAQQAARALGWHIPQDIAIIGFDDLPESAYFCPPLTTIRQPLVELGQRAVQLLHSRIASKTSTTNSIASCLPVELVVRQSTLRST